MREDAWPQVLIDDLRRLWAEGVTAAEIAMRLSSPFRRITKCAVTGKRLRLGLERRKERIIPGRKQTGAEAAAWTEARRVARGAVRTRRLEERAAGAPLPPVVRADPAPWREVTRETAAKAAMGSEAVAAAVEAYTPPSTATPPGHGCLYPMWPNGPRPTAAQQRFCGDARRQGSSYCDHHHRVAWVQAKKGPAAQSWVPGP